ncbi:16S rRNA (cytidine(1402)-2'-O)-methyltransferase [Pajaroellobacter abortibovis]|uniref:Ribosomal RNA small subunit methyltransferase I n=1 Tax=Pajaroellobacter abortibovis TaxID=1882918 RepID=A0A1L6MVB4_9BACT|nr:16S rRNA (cytidine(1402)-2'-O)-methyltransferase [Pajaroellobacter abortibovis]APR99460.1 16S rRNA (cytidine(1402)-2'-O)-methyltransferase [Pajaroellobacter abortibovis]
MSAATPGILFVVSTPIGNLEDITLRAIHTLRSCDHVVAEDTRRTLALLRHLNISGKPLHSLHAHSPPTHIELIVQLLEKGGQIALVTDAGTPLVSDPGDALISATLNAGFRVVPIPGPSAILSALVGSGLGGGRFRFFGFLPREGKNRCNTLLHIGNTSESIILFEAPTRIAKTLHDLSALTPNRLACIAREITKIHEEFLRGSLAELASLPREEWRGEITLVLGPHDLPYTMTSPCTSLDESKLQETIERALAEGETTKNVVNHLMAKSGGKSKRDLYAQVLQVKNRQK